MIRRPRFLRRRSERLDRPEDVGGAVEVVETSEASGGPRTILDVAGEQVHVVETGKPGTTPVLLSSGLGGAWFDWHPTADLLNEHHRVICFDRPGLGLSPARNAAPSLRTEVRLLAGLAEWAGPPIVVVAHSVAGFHAEAFARIHPGLVSGLVLVDPSSERETRSGMRVSAAVIPLARLAGFLFKITGLAKLIGPLARRLVLPRVSRSGETASPTTVRSVYGRGDVLGAVIAENSAYREMAADLTALRKRLPFPPIRLVVLTALGDARSAKRRHRWSKRHLDLARMSPHGRQVLLPDSLHMLPLDEPTAIAEAVAEVTR